MGFSRQEYWSGLPFPSPGDLPNPGTEPWSPALQVDASPSEPRSSLGNPFISLTYHIALPSWFHLIFLSSSRLPNVKYKHPQAQDPLSVHNS